MPFVSVFWVFIGCSRLAPNSVAFSSRNLKGLGFRNLKYRKQELKRAGTSST
jgi:hypothetical protein